VPPAVIFGAGKTGRGFAAHLCARSGLPFVLVDVDAKLVGELDEAGAYTVRVLTEPPQDVLLKALRCHQVSSSSWVDDFDRTSLAFTAVFGNRLQSLAAALAPALARRYGARGARGVLNIVTCENLAAAASVLRQAVLGALPDDVEVRRAVSEQVGFVEGIVLKTCLGPDEGGAPLLVRAENLFELPCDADAWRGPPPSVRGLQLTPNFQHQLVRKLYTYNCINAVITYLGAMRGFRFLSEAARDEEIGDWAVRAGKESGQALVKEFGFDADEQEVWIQRALAKFSDRNIPDGLERNGADPRRKLGSDDRLIGPARLCLRHGIEPRGIATGILAAVEFRDAGKTSLLETCGSFFQVLTEVCRLQPSEPLEKYLLARWRETRSP